MSNYQSERPGDSRSRAAGCLLPVLVGLILGLMAAGAAVVVAWLAIPVNYKASASLRIAANRPKILFDVGGEDELLGNRNATATLVTSRFVLAEALRKPGVSQLDYLRDEEDRLAWLKEHVEVSFPADSEIMEIAITGDDPSQLVALVNAVKDAFMQEVVGVDRENRLRRKRVLEQSYNRNLHEIKKKTTDYRVLAHELGEDDDPEFTSARRNRELEVLTELRVQQNKTQAELRGTEERVRVLKERLGRADRQPSPPAGTPGDQRAIAAKPGKEPAGQSAPPAAASSPARQTQLRDALEAAEIERAALTAMLQETKSEIQNVQQNVEKLSGCSKPSVELESRRAELQRLKEITETMGRQLEQWEVELAAAPRVSILEPASVPKTSDIHAKFRKVFLAACAALVAGFLAGAAAGGFLVRRAR